MFCRVKDIHGFTLEALDAEIGSSKDILFDDRAWVVRYLVADTHRWLPGGRKVVISPISLMEPDTEKETIPVKLSRKEIEAAPDLDDHKPVSREYEISLFDHLGYGYYWMGSGLWGPHPTPIGLSAESAIAIDDEKQQKVENHLRSTSEVDSYHIKTLDGEIGRVTEFILDTHDWSIPWLVIDTHTWMPFGKKVVAPTGLLNTISWVDRTVEIELTTDQVSNAPIYNLDSLNNERYQKSLRNYYKLLREENRTAVAN